MNKITSRLLSLCNAYPNASIVEICDVIILASSINKNILNINDSLPEQIEMIKTIEEQIKKQEYKQGTLFN